MKHLSSLKSLVGLATASAVALSVHTASAQVQVYSENFEVDHSLDNTWVTNSTGGYNPVDIYFDYSTIGIPSAPNSGGTTRGLKIQANLDPAVAIFPSGASMSPSGFSITSNFEMTWDWWLNYNGPLNVGGGGSTQIGGAGFGTAATSAQVPTIIDSVFVGASGDGAGTSADYRVYTPAFTASLQDASGVYAAGTVGSRNNTHAYYQSTFTPQSATNNCPAQLALYPQQTGLTAGGTAGMKWRAISLKKVGNIITYTIDGLLIATLDMSTNGTLGGNNIVFGHFDITTAASLDPNATNLAFSLVDNITITNFTNVVTVAATTPDASETGPTAGVFTISRTSSGVPLTVNYTLSGTGTNGVDYVTIPGSVTLDASATDTNISVTPIDDGIAETSETVILSITPALQYVGAGSATVVIADNESPQLSIANVSTQMYERTNDYATFRITRLGDTNAASFTPGVSFSGSATLDVDYHTNGLANFDPGVASVDVVISPIQDSSYEGAETVTCSIVAGGGYTIGSPSSASITVVDANGPAETILYSDNFNVDSSASWSQLFGASTNDFMPDSTVTFAHDYSAQGVPPAPHGSGDTLGLFLSVNKDLVGSAAGINLYPLGQSFSGNFALRFNMLVSLIPSAVGTEHALAGINHSGTKTNWFRGSPGGVPAGWTFDGIFYGVQADGSGNDYVSYSSPTTAGNNPTSLGVKQGTAVASQFKSPPWRVAGSQGIDLSLATPTPIWSDVEISQIGKIITLRINNTTILTYSNATAHTSGNVMVGYADSFDSIGNSSSYALIDNVRVVSVSGLNITAIQDLGADVQIDFTFGLYDVPASFKVQSSATVNGTYADTTATIVQLTPGTYRATVTKSGSAQFYRVRHL
jgi:hypothetical protein